MPTTTVLGLAIFFCEEPDSECFSLCRLHGLCWNCSTLSLVHGGIRRQNLKEGVRLCPKKTVFTVPDGRPDLSISLGSPLVLVLEHPRPGQSFGRVSLPGLGPAPVSHHVNS